GGGWGCGGGWCGAGGCCSTGNYPEPQWQGLQDHGQSEHCARRYRDPCEDRKTGSCYQLDRNGQRLMGRVRAARFRQRDLREAAGQPRRPAQGDRDVVFQGSGCRLGETGHPDRPQGHWHGSVWPVGYANQHYGKAISTSLRSFPRRLIPPKRARSHPRRRTVTKAASFGWASPSISSSAQNLQLRSCGSVAILARDYQSTGSYLGFRCIRLCMRQGMPPEKRFVYILRSEVSPRRCYVGLTS